LYEKPTAPAGIGGVLDDGLRLWRISLPLTWSLGLLAQTVDSAPFILFPPAPLELPPNMGFSQRMMLLMQESSRHSLFTFGLVMISYIFVNAVMLRINSVAEDREMSFSEAVALGAESLLRTWWFLILMAIGVVLFGTVVFIVAAAVGKSPALGAQILVGLIALAALIYIVYAAVKLVVGYPAMMLDDMSAWEALKASWNMMQGYWWRVALLLTVLGVIALVLIAVSYSAAGLMVALFGVGSRVAILMSGVAGILAYSLLESLSAAVILAIYNDLKLRTEGTDLAGRVRALKRR
jgi:Membrane domain of glycerophosphoryl diester phosphodiesterase